jgi:hypothetical protein
MGTSRWRTATTWLAGTSPAPRVLTAGLHVNGPGGYVTGGLASRLDAAARAEGAVELTSPGEIEEKLRAHIARGVDVIKIATTHGTQVGADPGGGRGGYLRGADG